MIFCFLPEGIRSISQRYGFRSGILVLDTAAATISNVTIK